MDPSSHSPDAMMTIRQRIFVSTLFAILIGIVATLAAWNGAVAGYDGHGPTDHTRYRLGNLATCIVVFQKETGSLPKDLSELSTWEHQHQDSVSAPLYSGIRDGILCDGWKTPIVYVHEGDHFTVTSLGADREPGGVGIDADMTFDQLGLTQKSALFEMTFLQFVREKTWRVMIITGMAPGVLAGLLCFVLVKKDWFNLLLPGLLTLLATLCVSYFMGILDIVKYH
jgi:Type II secretion system (T2SS), protein G